MLAWMKELLDKFLALLLSLMPKSPFADVIDSLGGLPYIGLINWFVPIGTFVGIGLLWLGAIAIYYAYSVVARWVKLVS